MDYSSKGCKELDTTKWPSKQANSGVLNRKEKARNSLRSKHIEVEGRETQNLPLGNSLRVEAGPRHGSRTKHKQNEVGRWGHKYLK